MNGILIINKPENYTSRDVVNKISKHLGTKKVGHTGTLDPIATGVLVICIGNCTKLCELLTAEYKEYVATIKLGKKTDTGDITGNIIEEKEYQVNKDQIVEVLNSFKGTSIQTVPIYSAIKVNGKKLYEYARSNKEVELPKREINVSKIELIDFHDDEIVFKTTVSKGTYIRSLIEDICTKLNTVGTMSSLTRTKQGMFTLEDSYTLEEIINNDYKITSKEVALQDLEHIELTESEYNIVKNGALITKSFNEEICALKYKDEIIAIYKQYEKDEKLAKPFKMF